MRQDPDHLAISSMDEQLTYGDLDAWANRLARRLKALGVGPNVLVGLCVDRSIEMIVGLLAILKAGGAYVPIDPAYPGKRIEFLLTDSGVDVVVTVSRVAKCLGECHATLVIVDDRSSHSDISAEPVSSEDNKNNLAYVIYTSGSTGVPKGVLVEHGNAVRLFEQTHHWFRFDKHDVWTMFHSISFDFSVWEIWGALLYGGSLVIVPHDTTRSPAQFLSLLKAKKVTVLNQTPSAFRQLIAEDATQSDSSDLDLRLVILGGEALDVKMLEPWVARYGDQRPKLINMYGITETTVHVTYKRITKDDLERTDVSPIGVPIPDLQVYLLDTEGRPAQDGTPGELSVGGPGVARGYLNRPELTASHFVQRPGGERLYRSGDLAVRLPGCELAYIGRGDNQIKVRGFRVEPREIELCLSLHPQVATLIVIPNDYGEGDVRLVAYVIPRFGLDPTEQPVEDLKADLAERAAAELPLHMRPSTYLVVSEIPMTAHGKVDREALRQMLPQAPDSVKKTAGSRGTTEEVITEIWEEVLQCKDIGSDHDFFDIGGTSLALIRIFGRVNECFNVSLDASVLIEEATISHLANCVDARLQNERAEGAAARSAEQS